MKKSFQPIADMDGQSKMESMGWNEIFDRAATKQWGIMVARAGNTTMQHHQKLPREEQLAGACTPCRAAAEMEISRTHLHSQESVGVSPTNNSNRLLNPVTKKIRP